MPQGKYDAHLVHLESQNQMDWWNTVWDGQWACALILGYEVISTLQVESFRVWHMGWWNILILVSIYVSVVLCDLVTLFKSEVMTLNLDYVYPLCLLSLSYI
jgi:hypothetical protein